MLDFLKRKKERYVEVSPSIVVFSVFFILGLYFLYHIKSIIILLYLAFIIMVALNPAVEKLSRRLKTPRFISILITYVIVITALLSIIALLVPPLLSELYQMLKTIDVPFLQNKINTFEFDVLEISELVRQLGSSVNMVMSFISSTFSSIFNVVTVFILSFYMIVERPRLHLKLSWFTNNKTKIKIFKKFLDSVEYQLGGWVRAELVLMSFIGVLTYIGLILLQIPYALPLALIAGLLEILPNLGPTIAAVPAIIIAVFNKNPLVAVVVVILYIVIQQIENNFLVPKIMKANADVNPLVSIVSILVGFKLAGVFGALLAIPSYIILRTVYSFWLRSNHKPL